MKEIFESLTDARLGSQNRGLCCCKLYGDVVQEASRMKKDETLISWAQM